MECVVYHWWSEEYDSPPAENLRAPILYSIASLRGVDKTIPIYILDGSKKPQNWHYWSSSLRFKVIPTTFCYEAKYAHRPGYKHLSRIEDIWNTKIAEEKIIYCDTDVFWIRSPRPTVFDGQRFAFNKYNTGFFYYNRTSPLIKDFHELWHAYVITALNDENFRVISTQYHDYREWYYIADETLMSYMMHKMPQYFDTIDINEHFTVGMSVQGMPSPDKIKMIHTNGMLVKNVFTGSEHARGLLPLMIKECWNAIEGIGQQKLEMLYTRQVLDKYLPHQRSLFDTELHQKLRDTKNEHGLCRLTQAVGITP
jgi:hypothetical protein